MNKNVKELKGKSVSELEKTAATLKMEIARGMIDAKVNPPKDTNTAMKKRKKLAVVLTLLTEKRMEEQVKKHE